MKNKLKYKILANRIFKYIKYFRKEGFSWLQEEDGSFICIDKKMYNEMLECWQNKPMECEIYEKEAICYKNNFYIKKDVKNDK